MTRHDLIAGIFLVILMTIGAVLAVDAQLNISNSAPLLTNYGGTATNTTFTAGSVVFAGTSGTYSQQNTGLYWDDTERALTVTTATGTALTVTATSAAAGNAYATFSNSGDNNNTWQIGRRNDGVLRLEHDGVNVLQADTSNNITLAQPTTVSDALVMSTTGQLTGRAFSALGACGGGTVGSFAVITDSNTTGFGNTIAGGGGNTVIGWCNATNWTVIGQ